MSLRFLIKNTSGKFKNVIFMLFSQFAQNTSFQIFKRTIIFLKFGHLRSFSIEILYWRPLRDFVGHQRVVSCCKLTSDDQSSIFFDFEKFWKSIISGQNPMEISPGNRLKFHGKIFWSMEQLIWIKCVVPLSENVLFHCLNMCCSMKQHIRNNTL